MGTTRDAARSGIHGDGLHVSRFVRTHPATTFFVLAWLFSWAFMVPLALSARHVIGPLPGWLHYLSAYGPLLAALVVSSVAGGTDGRRAWCWPRIAQNAVARKKYCAAPRKWKAWAFWQVASRTISTICS